MDRFEMLIDRLREIARGVGLPRRRTLDQAADMLENQRNEILALQQIVEKQADRFRETGQTPDTWAQGIGCWKGIAPEMEDKFEWMVWEDEVHCFDNLIAAIEERKRDEFWIFNPEKDDGSHDSEIRIVFWFDN